MVKYFKTLTSVLLPVLVTWGATEVQAGTVWRFQEITTATSQNDFGAVAMAMGVGATWPTVFSVSGSNQLTAYSLSPAGWLPTALDSRPSYARSQSGPNGQVGVVWQNQYQIRFAQSTKPGWPSTTVAAMSWNSTAASPDVAYLSSGRPVVAYSDSNTIKVRTQSAGGWDMDTVSGSSPASGICARVAVDDADNVAVAFGFGSQVQFAMRSSGAGGWDVATVPTVASSAVLSLAFTPGGVPVIALARSSGGLDIAAFDGQTGQWQVSNLTTDYLSGSVNLAIDRLGRPALAYIGTDQRVHYRINDGGGWADVLLPNSQYQPLARSSACLAFDRNNLPVIAYSASALSGGQRLVLAYDPVVTPEPASLVLLLAGMSMLRRKGKRGTR